MTTENSIAMERPEWLTQMENVLEVLNEGVIVASDEHRILFANSRLVEMTGLGIGVSRKLSAVRRLCLPTK